MDEPFQFVAIDEHPAFPNPADRNATIWRYMDFHKFESLATTKTLYMRRADLFAGDEFEGTTPAGELEFWKVLADSAENDKDRATILHNREQLSGFAADFRDKYFLSCWHMSPEENVAMWDRYVTTSESVTIRTRFSTLKAQLLPVINVGMVRYIDYEKDRLPSLNMLQLISHKRIFYADEREIRAAMLTISPEPVFERMIGPYLTPNGCGYVPPIDPTMLVEGVVLHPKASAEFARKVEALCAAHGLPIPTPSRMASKPRF